MARRRTLDEPWARSGDDAHGGEWSLTSAPTDDPPPAFESFATLTEPISLAGAVSPVLEFWHRYAIDDYVGRALVEVEAGDGAWVAVRQYAGSLSEWSRETVSLRDLAGAAAVRVRFHIFTYRYGPGSRWMIDDVAVTGLMNPCRECDGAGLCGARPDGRACGDGDLCNGDETCSAGSCAAAPSLLCDDANACTADSCAPDTGCTNTPAFDGAACSSPLFCDGTCAAGDCVGTAPADCDDENPCTADRCDLARHACVREPVADGAPCDDPDPCVAEGACAAGVCSGGTPITCDDGEPWTADWCDPGVGCRSANVAAGTACDDGDPATSGDVCDDAGRCVGSVPASSGCDCRATGGRPLHFFPALLALGLLAATLLRRLPTLPRSSRPTTRSDRPTNNQ
ncbi:MAG: hypothetical protein HY905_09065 [Deltaproteobacteria bacterium]|nr:hypothetical protein [Deltaproteobacteria bacterium]